MANIADDIADYLEDQAIGTVGTDIFVGRLIPSPDDQIAVFATGGLEPDMYVSGLRDVTFQVFIRNTDYATGSALLDSIRTTLHLKINLSLTNFRVLSLKALADGGHVGQDEEGRDEFSINFIAKTYAT